MLWGWYLDQYEHAKKWALHIHGLVLTEARDIQDAWDIENIVPPPTKEKVYLHKPLHIHIVVE